MNRSNQTYLRREQALKYNLRDIYPMIWGLCSLSIQAKVKQSKEFKGKDKIKDFAWLLNEIKAAIYKFDSKRDIFIQFQKRDPISNTRGNKKRVMKNFMILFEAMLRLSNILVDRSGTMRD